MSTAAIGEAPVSRETLFESLEAILPVLDRGREEAEETRRISPTVVAALKEGGFLRLSLPRTYGGLEADPVTIFQLVERISRVDSSVGWEVTIANSIAQISAKLPAEGTDLMFGGDRDALACGSLNSVGRAVVDSDGYRLTSQSPFNSGCRFSDWCLMQGKVELPGEPERDEPEILAMFCPIGEADIVDNWDVIGMRGTASNDVRVEGVFVPKELTFPVAALGQPSANPHYQGTVFRMPLCHQVPIAFAPLLGALRAALDWATDVARNKTPIFSSSKLRHRSIAQINFGKALGRYQAAYSLIETTLERYWEQVSGGATVTAEGKAEIYLSGVQAVELITEGIRQVASVAGTSWIRRGNPIERALRDIEVLRHHAYGNESRFGTVAQVHWDLEPDFPYINI